MSVLSLLCTYHVTGQWLAVPWRSIGGQVAVFYKLFIPMRLLLFLLQLEPLIYWRWIFAVISTTRWWYQGKVESLDKYKWWFDLLHTSNCKPMDYVLHCSRRLLLPNFLQVHRKLFILLQLGFSVDTTNSHQLDHRLHNNWKQILKMGHGIVWKWLYPISQLSNSCYQIS